MAIKVFISYSTTDISIAENVCNMLTSPDVEVFIASYSVQPGESLAVKILEAIRNCDIFVLLWSNNSKESNWVSQEIGVARGLDKVILPVVLNAGLTLPGLISELKYLEAVQNPSESLLWLQQYVNSHFTEQQQKQNRNMAILGILVLVIIFLNQK
jgi:hypothetical protein